MSNGKGLSLRTQTTNEGVYEILEINHRGLHHPKVQDSGSLFSFSINSPLISSCQKT
jgi:hypothetical protein